jgi:hypothetical protein
MEPTVWYELPGKEGLDSLGDREIARGCEYE